MDKTEFILNKVVDNLEQEACLFKDGKIVHTNELFRRSMNEEEIRDILGANRRDGEDRTFRAKNKLYTLKFVPLDDIYSLLLFMTNKGFHLVTDPLTGALHRECLDRLSSRLIEEARLQKKILSFLFIDLDEFKAVNDTWGHENGDVVLKATADRIAHVIRPDDFSFRIGGDEFVVILTDIRNKIHSCLVARRLIASISEPFEINNGNRAVIGASIGIASYPSDGFHLDELLNNADKAMYAAKSLGKNNYQLFR